MEKGFLDTLKALTSAESLEQAKLDSLWENISNNKILNNVTIVAIDKKMNRIVGTGSIIIEKHLAGKIGHVENIAVDKS
jgi:hypothetical protein